ncbi:uncharacterized protein TM35_000162110 [Trypanosoma theileri]|uniref:Uncharacterized protein n=1 Tax=Trypanosoma theileri TaxID=67003 RepID=A0A1X0NVS3_9TRYP|nr:uncharacterized protein TM35_000162110 [Trypanosoma theileri]ORC88573.1 hypothetical protein TM35_000162110 [Trypanosoma theileri]
MSFKRYSQSKEGFVEYCASKGITVIADYIVFLLLTELPENPCGAIAINLLQRQQEGCTVFELMDLYASHSAYKAFHLNSSTEYGSSQVPFPSVVEYVQFHGIGMLIEEWLCYLEDQNPDDVIMASRVFFQAKHRALQFHDVQLSKEKNSSKKNVLPLDTAKGINTQHCLQEKLVLTGDFENVKLSELMRNAAI